MTAADPMQATLAAMLVAAVEGDEDGLVEMIRNSIDDRQDACRHLHLMTLIAAQFALLFCPGFADDTSPLTERLTRENP